MENVAHPPHTNRLIDSTSPYLLQHAHNPVDWYPWGKEAIDKARAEDKPIFLSIGYSACHWCHVMERESFENESTADLMNRFFINVKVDREERPDLDEIYMSAVHTITSQGGWPLSVFLTPNLQPFYGGTYFPPEDRYGRPGFPSLIRLIAQTYQERREEILLSAGKLTEHIQNAMRVQVGEDAVDDSIIERCSEEMRRRFDPQHGGFGEAPKFPHSMDLSLLLRYARKTGDRKSLEIVEFSLQKMARGGMYDQLGGGFHRYSTDARWLIPHFEKMLYDNALLAKTYTEAFQTAQNPFYRRIVVETLEYVLREMTAPDGCFYSSQDTDSEGREGAFFVWTPEEIADAAGHESASLVCRYFGVEKEGNFEEGSSVLSLPLEDRTAAALFDIPVAELRKIIEEAKAKLFQARENRIKPGRDDKILTDWNGLAISAMAFAGNALGMDRYVHAAEKACAFILSRLQPEGTLLHTYKDGRAHTHAFLSDYSFLIIGLLDTYEATGNPRWLEEAIRLTSTMLERFWDEEGGAFFFTPHDGEVLIARSKNPMDNAVPSGNSMAALGLLRLAEMTGNERLRDRAEQCLKTFSSGLRRFPSAFTQMLSAADFFLSSPRQIVLAAPDWESVRDMKATLFQSFHPNKVVLYRLPETAEKIDTLSPLVQSKESIEGNPAAYVCRGHTCSPPVHSIPELLSMLEGS